MSWFSSASEWKQNLSPPVLRKVEELEDQVDKLKKERTNKQTHLDTLQQALEKQKLKTEEEIKQKQCLSKEVEHLASTCDELQQKLHPSRESHPLETSNSVSNVAANQGLLTKISELEAVNKKLANKVNELHAKEQKTKKVDSSNSSILESEYDFWGNFSSSKSANSQQKPANSPFKVVTAKRALETSEQNPFRTLTTPVKTAIQTSDENPFKVPSFPHTPFKNDNECSPFKTPVKAKPPPQVDYLNKQIKELQDQVVTYKAEISELKLQMAQSSVLSDDGKNQIALKLALEKSQASAASLEKELDSANDATTLFKSKAEDASTKLEALEQKMNTLQSELECQRHNNDAARKSLEEKFKEREKDLFADITQLQAALTDSEQQIKSLNTKLSQKDTHALSVQNAHQGTVDKLTAQLAALEKEKNLAYSQTNHLESQLAKFQKLEDDSTKMLNQLRQEKEMLSSQVENLKVKLTQSEGLCTKLESRIESTERINLDQKALFEDALATSKIDLEKERESQKTLLLELEAQNRKAEDAHSKLSLLESQSASNIKNLQQEKEDAIAEVTRIQEECNHKLSGVHTLEQIKTDLEAQISQKEQTITKLEDEHQQKLKSIKEDAEKQIKSTSNEMEAALEDLRKSSSILLENCKLTLGIEYKRLKDEKNSEIKDLQDKLEESSKALSEAQKTGEKAKEEKLAAEVSAWELEGKLEAATKSASEEKTAFEEKITEMKFSYLTRISNLEREIQLKEKALGDQEGNEIALRLLREKHSKLLETHEEEKDNFEKEMGALKESLNNMETSKTLAEKTILSKKGQIDEANTLITNLRESLKLQEEAEKENYSTIELLRDEVYDFKSKIITLNGEIDQYKRALQSSTEEIERLNLNIKTTDESMQSLDQLLEKANQNSKNLIEEVACVEKRLSQEKQISESKDNNVFLLQQELIETKEKLEIFEDIDKSYQSSQDKLQEETSKNSQQKAMIYQLESKVDLLDYETFTLKKERDEFKEKIVPQYQSQVEALENEKLQLLQTITEQNRELNDIRASLDTLSIKFDEIFDIDIENTEIKEQLNKFIEVVSKQMQDFTLIESKYKKILEERDLIQQEWTKYKHSADMVLQQKNNIMGKLALKEEQLEAATKQIALEEDRCKNLLDKNSHLRTLYDDSKKIINDKETQFKASEVSFEDFKHRLSNQIEELSLELSQARAVIVNKESKISSLETELSNHQLKIFNLEKNLQKEREALNSLRFKYDCYQEAVQLIGKHNSMQIIEPLQDSSLCSCKLHSNYEKEKSNLAARVFRLQKEKSQLQNSLHSLKLQISDEMNSGSSNLQLQTDLNEALDKLDVFQNEVERLSKEVVSQTQTINNLKTDFETQKLVSDKSARENLALQKGLSEKEKEIIDMGDAIQDLSSELEKIKADKDLLLSSCNCKSLKERENQIAKEFEELQDELLQTKAILQRTKEQKDLNINLAQEYEDKVTDLHKKLEEFSLLNKRLSGDLSLSRQSLKDAQFETEAQTESLKLENHEMNSKLLELSDKEQSLRDQIRETLSEKDVLVLENQALIKKTDDLTEQLKGNHNIMEEVGILKEKITTLNVNHKDLLARYTSLQEVLEDKETLIAQLEIEKEKCLCEILNEKEANHLTKVKMLEQIETFEKEATSLKGTLKSLNLKIEEECGKNEKLVDLNNDQLALNKNLQSQLEVLNNQLQDVSIGRDDLANDKIQLIAEKSVLMMEKDQICLERDQLAKENKALLSDKETVSAENKSIVGEKNSLLDQLQSLVNEKHCMLSENEKLTSEKSELLEENVQLNQLQKQINEENDFLKNRHDLAMKEIQSFKETTQQLQTKYQDNLTHSHKLEKKLSTLKSAMSKNDDMLKENHEKEIKDTKLIQELTTEIESIKLTLEEKLQEIDGLKSNLEKEQNQVNSFKMASKMQEDAIQDLNKTISLKNNKVDSLEKELNLLQDSLSQKENEVQGLQEEVLQSKKALTDAENTSQLQVEKVEKSLMDAKQETETLNASLKFCHSTLRKKDKEISNIQKRYETGTEKNKRLTEKIKEKESLLKQSQYSLNQAIAASEDWIKKFNKKSSELDDVLKEKEEVLAKLTLSETAKKDLINANNRLISKNKKQEEEISKYRKNAISSKEKSIQKKQTVEPSVFSKDISSDTNDTESCEEIGPSQSSSKDLFEPTVPTKQDGKLSTIKEDTSLSLLKSTTLRLSRKRTSRGTVTHQEIRPLGDDDDVFESSTRFLSLAPENEDSPIGRRVKRLSRSQNSNSSGKSEVLGIKKLSSVARPPLSKRMKSINEKLEGLPHKVQEGLNNIPIGHDILITRPATPSKQKTKEEKVPGGPLNILTNSPVLHKAKSKLNK